MKTLTAKDAKYGFGRLIDLARAEPVTAVVADVLRQKVSGGHREKPDTGKPNGCCG